VRDRTAIDRLPLIALALAAAVIACAGPDDTGGDRVATSVAATFSAAETATGEAPLATPLQPTDTSESPTLTPPPPATTPAPPAGGVSFNCDGTFQRFRLEDAGAAGKTAWVDAWNGAAWINVWSVAGGDPMTRQITDEAGLYAFGGCQQFVVVPMVYGGSGAVLELSVYAWTGAAMVEVYQHGGVHGSWISVGSSISFEESVYLYGEPNCCPCNRQSLEHTWNGSAFLQTASVVNPTYSGTPPPICVP